MYFLRRKAGSVRLRHWCVLQPLERLAPKGGAASPLTILFDALLDGKSSGVRHEREGNVANAIALYNVNRCNRSDRTGVDLHRCHSPVRNDAIALTQAGAICGTVGPSPRVLERRRARSSCVRPSARKAVLPSPGVELRGNGGVVRQLA